MNEYIDIVPYQQKGDPCYGGDTGETEYENYIKGTPELYHEREYRTIVREIIPHLHERDGDDAFNV